MQTMHLFAGIGGGLLSDLILGHTPIVAVEWDRYACAVLRERVADGWFSGMQAGVGEETRSGLYREVLRISDVVRPRYIFLENVSAILSIREKLHIIIIEKVQQLGLFGSENSESWAGKYIRRVHETYGQAAIGYVLGDLASRGYDARWICVRASDVGANHQRDRWWLLAEQRNVLNSMRDRCESNNGRGTLPDKIRNSASSQCERYNEQSRVSFTSTVTAKKLAYFELCGCLHSEPKEQPAEGRLDALCNSGSSCEDVANTSSIGQQGQREYERQEHPEKDSYWKTNRSLNSGQGNKGWWESEPNVGRVVDAIPFRVERLKGLGNAQVPLQAAVAFKILEGMM